MRSTSRTAISTTRLSHVDCNPAGSHCKSMARCFRMISIHPAAAPNDVLAISLCYAVLVEAVADQFIKA